MEKSGEGFVSDDPSVLSSLDDQSRKAKKPRKRYVVNLFPRVIKSDIRRFYPRMLANTANSHDPILMTSFLRTYCLPDFSSVDVLPSEIAQKDGFITEYSLEGLGLATIAFILQFDLMPDATILVKGSTIKQFRDDPNRSELHINMEYRGTKLFEFVRPESPSDVPQPTMLTSVALETDRYLDMLRHLSTSLPVPNSQKERPSYPCSAMPMMQKRLSGSPFFISNLCTMKIVMDSRHRLCSMECVTIL